MTNLGSKHSPVHAKAHCPTHLSHEQRHILTCLMYIPRPAVLSTPSTAHSAADTTLLSQRGHQPTAPVTAPAPHQKPPAHDARHVDDPSHVEHSLHHPHLELRYPPSFSRPVIMPLETREGLPRPTAGKRDALQSQNATVGAVVGVLLALFLVGFFWFVYRYHKSIRLRRRGSRGSSSRGGSGRRGRGSRSHGSGSGGGGNAAVSTESRTSSSSAESAAAAATEGHVGGEG